MALRIYSSNRVERLVIELARTLEQPLRDPFDAETIVVQSKGMQRWLSLELARIHGVCSNCIFPFPNAMVYRLFRAFLADLPEESPLSPDILAWRIHALLPSLVGRPGFEVPGNYLRGERSELKSFQLARRIADTFDQYTLFRGDLLEQWERGEGDDWQAHLWRELVGSDYHRGRLLKAFRDALRTAPLSRSVLPERVAIFGISYLPAFHLDILSLVARHTDVNLFVMSPTGEYWGDIVSPARLLRRDAAQREMLEVGNSLLASLGSLGRDFSERVVEVEDVALAASALYVDPGNGTLLQRVQSDILHLRRGESAALPDDDRSMQFHSCHSPMREVEVLHDHLLHMLESLDGLEPRDILVMTPDIEAYAPYITAVFAGGEDEGRSIPFAIADRSLGTSGDIARVLRALLRLPDSRFSAPEILDLLGSDVVRGTFGFSSSDIDTIRRWIERTGIRWGIDAAHRAAFGLPEYAENTWRSGIQRLLLGFAMPDEGELVEGVLPYDDVEGDSAILLGRFLSFLDTLFAAADALRVPRSLPEWGECLLGLLGRFVVEDDERAPEAATIRGIFDRLGALGQKAGYNGAVSLEVVRSWLVDEMAREEKGLSFLTGGVTFCALLPMRSIPFRVIAILGMNDGTFPRQSRPPGFDLIARHPRRGDRSLREEDRYLFLEALLSAREVFYVSYVGQSIRDNAEIPPSVVVSELLDTLECLVPSDAPARLVVRHPLQPFAPAYFRGDRRLFSYSVENCAAASCERRSESRPFLSAPMVGITDEVTDLPLAMLLRFFDNPARHFLRERLGIRLQEVVPPPADREPFDLDALVAYTIREELLAACLDGVDPRSLYPLFRARGMLPPGEQGELVFVALCGEVERFHGCIAGATDGAACLPAVDVDFVCGGFRLFGRIDRVWENCLLRFRCAKLKPRDQVRSWIEHLVLNAEGSQGSQETRLVMLDKEILYRPTAETHDHLHVLLEQFRRGNALPLKFFCRSSLAYADGGWNLDKARRQWEGDGGFYDKGEGSDPWLTVCFGSCDPFDDDFDETARTVLEPLVRHREG